jgi:hypothetical protein
VSVIDSPKYPHCRRVRNQKYPTFLKVPPIKNKVPPVKQGVLLDALLFWMSWDAPELCLGGETGIRTLGTLSSTHAFQACAFSHSAISPLGYRLIESTIRGRLFPFLEIPTMRYVHDTPSGTKPPHCQAARAKAFIQIRRRPDSPSPNHPAPHAHFSPCRRSAPSHWFPFSWLQAP